MLYTSQSATSIYEECPRRRYFNYHYDGSGIVATHLTMYLTTGSCIHKAVQHIVEQYLITGEYTEATIDAAVDVGIEEYRRLVDKHMFGRTPDEHQAYTKLEQEALTEVLIRIWWLMEFPKIIEHYHILAVEQEISCEIPSITNDTSIYNDAEDIIYMCKPDLILIHKQTGNLVNYSLKAVKGVYGFAEEAYTIANQAFTEPYFTEKWIQQIHHNLTGIEYALEMLPRTSFMSKKFDAIMKFIAQAKSTIPTYISSIRFCFLIKGNRTENPRGSKKYYTDNPFLYGWRKFTPSETQYAWTQYTNNPQNKSGYGKLGKGWEEFATFFEQHGEQKSMAKDGVKAWITALYDNRIPNDIGDGKGNVFQRHILSQPDIQVNPMIMQQRVNALIEKEKAVQRGLRDLEITGENIVERKEGILNLHFPIVSSACFYPTECDYLPICPNGNQKYRAEIAADPLNVDFGPRYERRIPHHETELKARMKQIIQWEEDDKPIHSANLAE